MKKLPEFSIEIEGDKTIVKLAAGKLSRNDLERLKAQMESFLGSASF